MSLMRWVPLGDGLPWWSGLRRLPAVGEKSPVDLLDVAMDMYETGESVVVEMSVPGMDPKDIEVRLVGNRLSVEGEVRAELKTQDQTYVVRERRYGKFHRSVTLPDSVKGSEVQAEFSNGVLKLTAAKQEEAKPKTVKVTAK
jgi:HSP20 family protein